MTTTKALLSTLPLSLALLSICLCAASTDESPFGYTAFLDLKCKGVHDKSIFARLDRMCEDCYELFQEDTLKTLCSGECFSSEYFRHCLTSLGYYDEQEEFRQKVEYLDGKGFDPDDYH